MCSTYFKEVLSGFMLVENCHMLSFLRSPLCVLKAVLYVDPLTPTKKIRPSHTITKNISIYLTLLDTRWCTVLYAARSGNSHSPSYFQLEGPLQIHCREEWTRRIVKAKCSMIYTPVSNKSLDTPEWNKAEYNTTHSCLGPDFSAAPSLRMSHYNDVEDSLLSS